MDEYDRMLFQYSDQAGLDAERTTFQERLEGFAASILEEVQSKSDFLHLDQGPEHFQRIIEATKEYQAAHSKMSKPRKGNIDYIKD